MRLHVTIAAFAAAALLASCVTPAARPFRVAGDASLVSREDFAAIVDVVRRDLARLPDRPPIKTIAIVSRNKAIVTYRSDGPIEWPFCIVVRSRGGWRVTQHNVSIA
jgi:hypothetical protein